MDQEDQRRLGEFARSLRGDSAPFENRFWSRSSRSQLGGHKFRRRRAIDGRIVDIFCPAEALFVEVDGGTHFTDVEARRNAKLACKRYAGLRFTNAEVRENLEGVLDQIRVVAGSLPDRWHGAGPRPNRSPEREGC